MSDEIPEAELAELQAAMLHSALRAEPLPGSTVALSLPDLGFLRSAEPALLLRENLAPSLVDAPPPEVRVAAPGARPDAGGGADAAYLRFQPPSREGDTVWVTLELRLAGDPEDGQPLGLGGVQAGFRRTGDAWHLAEAPRTFGM